MARTIDSERTLIATIDRLRGGPHTLEELPGGVLPFIHLLALSGSLFDPARSIGPRSLMLDARNALTALGGCDPKPWEGTPLTRRGSGAGWPIWFRMLTGV